MTLRHPLEFIPSAQRHRLFFIFLALTIAGFGIFQILDEPLRTPAAPTGLVSFELAGSPEKARAMLDSWDAKALLNNAFGLGFDYLFMPVYAIALSMGVLLACSRRGGFWPSLGAWLGWGALIAPLFDACENLALFSILRAGPLSPYPQIAAGCATLKFALILVGLVYGLVGWLGGKNH